MEFERGYSVECRCSKYRKGSKEGRGGGEREREQIRHVCRRKTAEWFACPSMLSYSSFITS